LLLYAHGVVQWNAADAASTTYAIAGLGFRPQAMRFTTAGIGSAVDAGSATAHLRRGIGLAAGPSARRCVGTQDQDNVATMVCTAGFRDDCVAMALTATGPAADGLLDLDSVNDDGFVLVVDDQAPVDLTVMWQAWGGPNTQAFVGDFAEPAATGTQTYTVTGVTPTDNDQILMLAGVQATGAAPTAERTDAGMCAGYAMTGGGAARQIVTAHNSRDNVADSVAGQYGTDAQCLAMFLIGGTNADISARARFLQWQTDAFQLEWDERGTTDRRYIYLVIQGGLWRCGELTIDAQTAGAQATVSGLSFKPIGIDTMTVGDNENVSDTGRAVADMVLGSGISPTDRLCLASCALHNQASASVQSRVEYDQIGVIPNVDGTVYTAYDLDKVSNDGFRMVVDANQAAESAVEWHGWLAFGNPWSRAFEPNIRPAPFSPGIAR
jgi:hypothetical protein